MTRGVPAAEKVFEVRVFRSEIITFRVRAHNTEEAQDLAMEAVVDAGPIKSINVERGDTKQKEAFVTYAQEIKAADVADER